jgi:hypothetical protein
MAKQPLLDHVKRDVDLLAQRNGQNFSPKGRTIRDGLIALSRFAGQSERKTIYVRPLMCVRLLIEGCACLAEALA